MFNIFSINVVKDIPYKKPVSIRFVLFDSYWVKYCVVPSIISGIISIDIFLLKIWIGAIISAKKWPITIPVHLAHTGNWYPFIKKLRSGIWWHPQYLLHQSINLIHDSSFFLILWIYFRILDTPNSALNSLVFLFRRRRTKFLWVPVRLLHSILFRQKNPFLLLLFLK